MKKILIITAIIIFLIFWTGTIAFAETKRQTALNNPYNIKKSKTPYFGKDNNGNNSAFEGFRNITFSTAAFFKLIRDNYYLKGYDTIEKILYRYAPPSDNNNTEQYIQYVSQKTGVDRNTKIDIGDFKMMYALASAICRFESSFELDSFQAWRGYHFYLFYY